MKLLKMSNFTFFFLHNVFRVICILKSFNKQISELSSAASLNLGRSQNVVLVNGLKDERIT